MSDDNKNAYENNSAENKDVDSNIAENLVWMYIPLSIFESVLWSVWRFQKRLDKRYA